MATRLTRRRFARLAVAGGVAAGSIGLVTAPFANTIFARSVEPVLLGIKPAPLPATDSEPPVVDRTEVGPSIGRASSASFAVSLLVHSFDLSTGQVRSIRNVDFLGDGRTPALFTNEVISGSAVLKDGSLALAITPIGGSANQRDATRLTRPTSTAASLPLTALRSDEMLTDLTATVDGRLLGLVMKRTGAAPARLVSIDMQTARLSALEAIDLPGYWRVATLTQSPQGSLYSVAINRSGETNLIQLGARGGQAIVVAPLIYGGIVWNNGLQNLVYSSSGELIAFGAMRYETTNTLYRVDQSTGEMSRLYDFDVASVAAASA